MKLGEGVEWGLHCCVLLSYLSPGRVLPGARLAEFHGLPPAYLAKHLQALANAGILRATAGRAGGYALAREPERITLLDVVRAVEGDSPAFVCTEIRKGGPCAANSRAYRRSCGIARSMARARVFI